MKLQNNIIEYIRNRYITLSKERGYTTKIIDEVLEKFNIIINKDHIRYYCIVKIDELRDKIQKLNDDTEDDEPFTFENDRYTIKESSFTREEMDEIFRSYSKFGKNMTGDEMIKEFGFKPETWDSLKRAMRLYKTSHVICPETAKRLTEDELNRVIEDSIGESHDRIKAKMVNTNRKMEEKELKKLRQMYVNWDYHLQELRNTIMQYKPIAVNFTPVKIENDDKKMFVMTDIHLGKIHTDEVIKRLDMVYQNIINSHERIIYIAILGDLVETFVPDGMHDAQIAYGVDHSFGVGFTAMLKIAQIFEKFFIGLAKAGKEVHVHGITGNHGRITSKKENDPERTGELIVYELIKRALQNIEIQIDYYRELVATFKFGGINVICHHGDYLDKQPPEKVVVTYGEVGMHSLILSGDKHAVKMSEGKNWTNVKSPALAGQGIYDKTLNLHSEAGYLEIKENQWHTPDIMVRRLK